MQGSLAPEQGSLAPLDQCKLALANHKAPDNVRTYVRVLGQVCTGRVEQGCLALEQGCLALEQGCLALDQGSLAPGSRQPCTRSKAALNRSTGALFALRVTTVLSF